MEKLAIYRGPYLKPSHSDEKARYLLNTLITGLLCTGNDNTPLGLLYMYLIINLSIN